MKINTFSVSSPLAFEMVESLISFNTCNYLSETTPLVSVVIVAYKANHDLILCLKSLCDQTFPNFEIIIVDNGGNEMVYDIIMSFPIRYIRLKDNFLPSLARNIGVLYAKGDIVCFLDDDAIADPAYVEEHNNILKNSRILGVRGKILPKTDSIYNCLAYHYDLGSEIIPSYVDMENNASFRRETLISMGGFAPNIFAGEGAELSYRIYQKYSDHNSLIYLPTAVVYHDFSDTLKKYIKKTIRGAKMRVLLDKQYPDYSFFLDSYHPFPIGEIPGPKNFRQRVFLALLRRFGKLINFLTRSWFIYRLKEK